MAVLGALVAVLFVLLVLDLLVTTAILRRMRLYERERSESVHRPGGPPVGRPIPEFQARGSGGAFDHRTILGQETLIAFLSSTCAPCVRLGPRLVRRIPELAASGVRTLVVIRHTEGQPTKLLDIFPPDGPVPAGGATVVVEEPDAPGLVTAFEPDASPSFFHVGADGVLLAKGIELDAVITTTATVR